MEKQRKIGLRAYARLGQCALGLKIHAEADDIKLVDNSLCDNNRNVEWAGPVGGQVRFVRNHGFATQNSGLAAIDADGTSVTVPHGLAVAPRLQNIRVTPANSMGRSVKFWIARPDAAGFDIVVDVAPGDCRAEFAWSIVV